MTPRGRWPTPPDGDNTPQGKLAHGCVWLFYFIVFLIVMVGLAQLAQSYFTKAFALELHDHQKLGDAVGDFYSTWRRPNSRGGRILRGNMFCCSERDCYQAMVRGGPDHYEYMSRWYGAWRPLPDAILEHNQSDPHESPNGFSHVCESTPPNPVPICAVFGREI